MMIQLNPAIPVTTPKGDGYAQFLLDYSSEFDLHWVVFLDESGECWTFNNKDIRAQKNITLGRACPKPFEKETNHHSNFVFKIK